jgi:DNA-binding response OmpR family regulator
MIKKIKLLLVEDEIFLGQIVRETLEKENFEVVHETNGLNVIGRFHGFKPHICIFDIMLPGKDGYTLVQEIRSIDKEIPIIFLTAKSQTEDVVKGFERGCNDYIRKPFSMEELIVRIHALLQRHHVSENIQEDQKVGKYLFNSLKQELRIGKDTIRLTSRETDLFKLLLRNRNAVLDKKATLLALWGDDTFFTSRSMDVFITKLRKYLGKDTSIQIINIRGQGYKLIVDR